MRPGSGRISRRSKLLRRLVVGLVLGAVLGYGVSAIAASAGSQCILLCNDEVAVPYFAVMGLLVAWR